MDTIEEVKRINEDDKAGSRKRKASRRSKKGKSNRNAETDGDASNQEHESVVPMVSASIAESGVVGNEIPNKKRRKASRRGKGKRKGKDSEATDLEATAASKSLKQKRSSGAKDSGGTSESQTEESVLDLVNIGTEKVPGTAFVRGLPTDGISRRMVTELLEEFGEITSTRLVFDKQTRKAVGTAFVDFASAKSVKKAEEKCKRLGGFECGGKKVRVSAALTATGVRAIATGHTARSGKWKRRQEERSQDRRSERNE